MNVLSISFLFLGLCCFENGYAKSNTDCAAHMTAFPPEIGTGCCGDDLSGLKKIENRETALNQYPWTVIIEYSRSTSKRYDMCGGTLISGRYVLTTAFCIAGTFTSSMVPTTIRLGDYNITNDGPDCVVIGDIQKCTEGETRIEIERKIPHPQYRPDQASSANDIGLIRMKKTAPYTDFIRPICLPTEDVTLKTGPLNFIFAGWGTLSGLGSVKLHSDLPCVPRDQCLTAFSAITDLQLGEGQICAGGEKGKNACRGDGGLPLIYETNGKYVVAGIVSFGTEDCKSSPTVFTNVFQYNTWIGSNIIL